VQCPKDKGVVLENSQLAGAMSVYCCHECKGTWIPAEEYYHWKETQSPSPLKAPSPRLEVDYVQSPLDNRAALCPDCNHYLARARINVKNAFYVERCPNCGGIWCDRGEWNVLETLGLHTAIDQLFLSEWQARVKEVEYAERERSATIEKLGDDLAQKVFELAELLKDHPNGDFGVAYLMRRFEK
jgi:Zn-finger nucleic acid-binding protein